MREYFVRVYDAHDYLELHIKIGYFEGGNCYQLFGTEYKEVDRYAMTEPTLRVHLPDMSDDNIGQKLVDGLIKCGIQPTLPIKNEPVLESIKYHLEDMRKLVFKTT